MRLKYYSLFLLLIVGIGANAQSDVTIGTNYSLNLQLQDPNADAWIFHNSKTSSTAVTTYVTTHPTFGARGIMFRYIDGIHFYASSGATTANASFTPTERFFIGNNGYLGVGATVPTAKFHISSATERETFRIYKDGNTSNYLSIFQGAGAAAIDPIGTGMLYLGYDQATTVLMNGNLGIKTTTPSQSLEVHGNILQNIENAAFGIDAQPNARLGFIKKSGYGPMIASDNVSPIIFSQTNQTGVFTNIAGATLTERMRIETNGNVGIGQSNPAYKLDVNGPINASALNVNGQPFIGSQWTTAGSVISYMGKVGIGTPLSSNPNTYTLAVNGTIGARDVRVEKSSATWPDYVFDKNYNLPSLTELEQYIQEHKHLENVPSAKEVNENGYSVNEMDVILLKKIEELSLYIIQQQKEIDELKRKVEKNK